MAYENIIFRKRNMTMVDGYFYMMDIDQDALIVKTDDGTQAFSYPLDTVLDEYTTVDTSSPSNPTYYGKIKSLEHDGRNFWSLENLNNGTIIIRRWYIDNYVLKLRNTFTLASGSGHTFNSRAFTVEHYHLKFGADTYAGASSLSVVASGINIASDNLLRSGMVVTLGPNSFGQIEERQVNSVPSNDTININGTTSYNFSAGDPISFYNRLWVFNNAYGIDTSTGALYAIDAYTGGIITSSIYPGGIYRDIEACTFYDLSLSGAPVAGNMKNVIAFVKATNLLFLNPLDIYANVGSMSMDNLEQNQSTIIPVFDLAMEGNNVYRLQQKATYYGTTYNWSTGPFNYQVSPLQPFVTSISLRANPAVLPANGVNVSTITAIVKDQYNSPMAGKIVYFTDDDPVGTILTNNVNTNAQGVAVTAYRAGTSAREVKITATVQQF